MHKKQKVEGKLKTRKQRQINGISRFWNGDTGLCTRAQNTQGIGDRICNQGLFTAGTLIAKVPRAGFGISKEGHDPAGVWLVVWALQEAGSWSCKLLTLEGTQTLLEAECTTVSLPFTFTSLPVQHPAGILGLQLSEFQPPHSTVWKDGVVAMMIAKYLEYIL